MLTANAAAAAACRPIDCGLQNDEIVRLQATSVNINVHIVRFIINLQL